MTRFLCPFFRSKPNGLGELEKAAGEKFKEEKESL
jgi:hypothetical protein